MRISDWSSDVCSSDLDAQEQALDARQSNAFAILRGTGARASLMLYAPTDTVTSNSADEDTPWAAAELLPEMRAEAVVADGLISGLGAHNPKGPAACAIVAFAALAESDVVPSGKLINRKSTRMTSSQECAP